MVRQASEASSGDPHVQGSTVEKAGSTTSGADPYMFNSGIKTEEELGELRRRKGAGKIEKYQREQNDVRW